MINPFIISLLIFWQSWSVYLVTALALIIVLLLIRRYELNRIRLRNQLRLEKIETESLRSMDRVKSKFFANISHEFRTPLTLILAQVENMMSTVKDLREEEKLQAIERNARKLLLLINQILDLSKIDAEKMELTVTRQDIVVFVKGILFSFESPAASKNLTLAFKSEPGQILLVFDPDKMEKILCNVLTNAVKYSEEEGKVSVSIHAAADDKVEIRIENSGRGIPAGHLPHIFDRFYRVDGSGSTLEEGTGIGLALARELVELHRGKISVESIEGVNTVFFISIPTDHQLTDDEPVIRMEAKQLSSDLYAEMANSDHGISETKNGETESNERELILVVEDNAEVREFLREQLSDDYLVITAENGKAGLAMAKDTIPDLIISDLMMPVMDGCRFCKEIRNNIRTSHIPVIMLTARAGLEDKIEGLETGADDFIIKPFISRELKARVRNLIHQRKILRDRFSTATIIKPSDISALPLDRIFIEKVIRFIESNFENPKFSVDSLSSELSISVSQLNRKLNALTGQPAGQLIRSMRLQRAADLLALNAGTVAQISYQLGFSDQAYFSRAFRKQFGCTPGEYKKEQKVQDIA